MVTEDAAGAAVLLTVVLLFVVSALEDVAWAVKRPTANVAAENRMKFVFRDALVTIQKFFFFIPLDRRLRNLIVI